MLESRASRWRFVFPPLVSIGAGVLLLFAAGAKARQIAANPAAYGAADLLKTVELAWLPLEATIGLWLLTNWRGRLARRIGTLVFLLFTLISGYKWHSQAASCGCFGEIDVPPSAMVVLDSCMTVLLFVAARLSLRPQPASRRWFATAMALTCGTAVAAGGFWMGSVKVTFGKNGVVNVQQVSLPAEWIGHELPLLGDIDLGQELRSGDWLVLLYRRDCPQCQQVLAAINNQRPSEAWKTCAVEVPPYGPESPPGIRVRQGRLSEKSEWFVPTPVLVWLSDGGVVKQVKVQDDAANIAKRGFSADSQPRGD